MREVLKKPQHRVVAISKSREVDEITAYDLRYIAALQAAAWQADRAVQSAISEIKLRLLDGATVEHCDLYFDEGLSMVRGRREEKVGG